MSHISHSTDCWTGYMSESAMKIWLFLLPILPAWTVFNAPLAFRSLSLPSPVKALLGLVVGTSVLAAIFSPHPFIAVAASVAHALMLCGLVTLGARYRHDVDFWPVVQGLSVTVGLAILYTIETQASRLTHPVWAATSIGLGGALLVLFAAHIQAPIWLRTIMIIGGSGVVFWSGSRGAVLALIISLLVSSALRAPGYAARIITLAIVVLVGVTVSGGRWSSVDDGGRELLWFNARAVISSHPLTGVGRWQLGNYLWPEKECLWWQELELHGLRCQDYLGKLQPQVVTHNAALQSLGELGIIGVVAEFLFLGVTVFMAWEARQSVALGVLVIVIIMGLTDNPLFLPGPFGGAFAYVVAGYVLVSKSINRRTLTWGGGIGLLILALTLLPPIMIWARPDKRPIQIRTLSVGLDHSRRYHNIQFDLIAPPGTYHIDLLACLETCSQLRVIEVQGGQRMALMQVAPPSFPTVLVLRVLNNEGFLPQELGKWAVRRFGDFAPMP